MIFLSCPLSLLDRFQNFIGQTLESLTSISRTTMFRTQMEVSSELRFKFFNQIKDVGRDWDRAAPMDNLFLQRPYLEVLERYPPDGTRMAYLVFYQGQEPIGVALCQIKKFKAIDSLQDLDGAGNYLQAVQNWMRKCVACMITSDVLICGNLLLTGEHGYYFNPEKIDPEKAIALLDNSLRAVASDLKGRELKTPVTLIKDVEPARLETRAELNKRGYFIFQIQPNMVLPLKFDSFEGYLSAMSTKYRTRAKRAFKKLDGIEFRTLDVRGIENALPELHRMYQEVAQSAGFNMVTLNPGYLLGLKQSLGDKFNLVGLYLNDRLIAFYTTILNHQVMEAHFLGYEKEYNHDHQVYLNMLYRMVSEAIQAGAQEIIFARTALEIKSSVGAEPHQLNCCVRHDNPWINRLAGVALEYLSPTEQWVQRHPFKSHEIA